MRDNPNIVTDPSQPNGLLTELLGTDCQLPQISPSVGAAEIPDSDCVLEQGDVVVNDYTEAPISINRTEWVYVVMKVSTQGVIYYDPLSGKTYHFDRKTAIDCLTNNTGDRTLLKGTALTADA
jgi:hypothetical protein